MSRTQNLLTVLTLSLLAVADASGATAVDRLNAFLAEVQSLESRFGQELYDENAKLVEKSGGRFYLQRPDRFRWSYSEPYLQEIVADGSRLWIYDSELDQVTVRSLDNALGDTPALLLSSAVPLEENFVVREVVERTGLDWVELTPRSADSGFASVLLGFAGSDLERMELVDNFGQTTHLEFSGTRHNPELDPTVFRFTLPAGVDVITEQ